MILVFQLSDFVSSKGYAFQCRCPACTTGTDASDLRRGRLGELMKQLNRGWWMVDGWIGRNTYRFHGCVGFGVGIALAVASPLREEPTGEITARGFD